MMISNYSKNIENPKPIDIERYYENDDIVRLSVPILKEDGSYKYVGFTVSKEELMYAINNC